MYVTMPYGTISIVTREEAVDFILHHCSNCDRRTLYDPCSGAQAKRCREQITLVIAEFSNKE